MKLIYQFALLIMKMNESEINIELKLDEADKMAAPSCLSFSIEIRRLLKED